MQTFVIQHKCGFKAALIRLKVLEKSDLLSVFGAQCACQMSFHLMIACKDSLKPFLITTAIVEIIRLQSFVACLKGLVVTCRSLF